MSMIDSPKIEALSRFLDVEVARHKLITSNLLDFRAELRRAGSQVGGSEGGGLSYASYSYSPVARPVRGLLERPDGNNVSVERESLLLAETQMKFSLGVQLLKSEFHEISAAITSGGTSS